MGIEWGSFIVGFILGVCCLPLVFVLRAANIEIRRRKERDSDG